MCHNKFIKQNTKACRLRGCGKNFLKTGRPCIAGKWFCCDEHAEQDPETKTIIALMKHDEMEEDDDHQGDQIKS